MAATVVWLNGSFGAGKTTVAGLLAATLPAVVIDPEELGPFLKRTMPSDVVRPDFQDMPVWRDATRELVRSVATHVDGYVVVPMTIAVASYFDEIVEGLRRAGIEVRHFTLRASRESATERLRLRGDTTAWAFAQVDRCVTALEDARYAIHIETDGRSPAAIATSIAAVLR